MVTEQKVKDYVRRSFEIYNTRDLKTIASWYDEFLTPDCVYHNPGVGRSICGRENVTEFVRALYHEIPDLYHNAADDIIVQGNRVAYRYSVSRTDPDSGKRQTSMILAIDHFTGDRVAAMWELVGPWEGES